MKKTNFKSIMTKICLLFAVCLLVSFNPIKAEAATVTGQDIVTEAKKYLGVPYQWGGNGPSTFDCSGFTKYVYNQFGIYLPRVASDQANAGTYVAKSDLQPGDLVFFGNPAYHVGIYVGSGNYIHAPQDNEVVKISALSGRSDYSTARRFLATTTNGWVNSNGKYYYYSNGTMVTGWNQISDVWYYFESDGTMVTSWKQISGVWYYFNEGGHMMTGWQQISGVWYYFNEGGHMMTGWQTINNKRYYFDEGGHMLTGKQTIGGIVYTFDIYGALIQ